MEITSLVASLTIVSSVNAATVVTVFICLWMEALKAGQLLRVVVVVAMRSKSLMAVGSEL